MVEKLLFRDVSNSVDVRVPFVTSQSGPSPVVYLKLAQAEEVTFLTDVNFTDRTLEVGIVTDLSIRYDLDI